MNQSEEYLDFILRKFSSLDVVSARKMFGGYVLHMAGKVLGFVFDDCFLFEPGPTIDRLLPDAQRKELFPGSKLFVVIDDSIGDRRLCQLAEACYEDFPLPKPRKRKKKREEPQEDKRFPFAKHVL